MLLQILKMSIKKKKTKQFHFSKVLKTKPQTFNIDQECFKSPEDFNPFVDLVVPTLRKYNQKLTYVELRTADELTQQ